MGCVNAPFPQNYAQMTNAQKENSKVKDVISDLQKKGLFDTLIKIGMIPTQWYDYSNIYNLYLSERNKGQLKMQCYLECAVVFNCSVEKIRLIIRRMNENI